MRLLPVLLLALSLAGCRSGGLDPLPEAPPGDYRLDSGDAIRLIVLEDPQINGDYVVSDRGELAIPRLGAVPARGLTLTGLKTELDGRLRRLLTDPSASLEIKTFRPFFVLGQVARPGQYPYQPGMTVLTAVAVAGGFTVRARTDEMSIVRTLDDKPMEGLAGRSTRVLPGDVVYVFDRVF